MQSVGLIGISMLLSTYVYEQNVFEYVQEFSFKTLWY